MSFKEFHSTIKNLKHIRQFAEQELLKNSVPQNIINEIKIVIGEATANIYKYGYLKDEDVNKERGFKDTFMIREYINTIIDTVPPTIN